MALTPIDFPDDPSTGDSFTAGNGVTYTWYNNRWNGKVNDVILTVPPEEIELNMLQDVCDDVPADGDVLTWDGTEWCGKEGPVDGVSPVVTVGATNTLPAGSPANVTQAPTADGTELTFSIPQGEKGEPGTGITFKGTIDEAGPPNFDGTADGDMWVDVNDNAWIWEGGVWIDAGSFAGPPGTPGTQVSVGSTTTVEPSQPAAVTETVDGNNLQLNFFIPKGEKGDAGSIDNMPDGVVTETGHYENGDVVEGIKFGRGGGSDKTYPIDFAIRTDVTFNGAVEFDSRGTVTGLNLETLDNVTFTNPQPGDALKYAGGGQWVNGTVSGGGSGSDTIDLTPYTRRDTKEYITDNWTFERPIYIGPNPNAADPTSKISINPSGVIELDAGDFDTTGDGGAIRFFYNDYEVYFGLTPIRISNTANYETGLLCRGGGITFAGGDTSDAKAVGETTITPRGIDLYRNTVTGTQAHIDFMDGNPNNIANKEFDVRLQLANLQYGNGSQFKTLQLLGEGIEVRPPDTAPNKGSVWVTSRGIDIARPDGYGWIRFKNEMSNNGYDVQLTGDNNRLEIRTAQTGGVWVSEANGAYYKLGPAGATVPVLPGAGVGLYYTGTTLNVDTSVVKTEQEIRDIAIDVLADYQPIDPD